MFFMRDEEYILYPVKLGAPHQWYQEQVRQTMVNGITSIAVSNTFTQEWEMEPYIDMAAMHGHRVFSLIVENRHGGQNVHNVPASSIEKIRNSFQVSI